MKKIIYIILTLILFVAVYEFSVSKNRQAKKDDILGEIIGASEKEQNNQKFQKGNADLKPENTQDIVLEIPEADKLENRKELEERLKRLGIKIVKTELIRYGEVVPGKL